MTDCSQSAITSVMNSFRYRILKFVMLNPPMLFVFAWSTKFKSTRCFFGWHRNSVTSDFDRDSTCEYLEINLSHLRTCLPLHDNYINQSFYCQSAGVTIKHYSDERARKESTTVTNSNPSSSLGIRGTIGFGFMKVSWFTLTPVRKKPASPSCLTIT